MDVDIFRMHFGRFNVSSGYAVLYELKCRFGGEAGSGNEMGYKYESLSWIRFGVSRKSAAHREMHKQSKLTFHL